MPQRFDHARPFDSHRHRSGQRAPGTHSFGEVQPILDAGNSWDMVRQIMDFMSRHQGYRLGVPDTSFFPFSAICRLNLTFPSGPYHGTGFYISPNLILTCGHNLFDRTPDKSATEACTAITVRVGQQNATTWLDSFDLTAANFTAHPTFVASGARDHDFDLGILRVPHNPPGGHHFCLINYSPSAETPLAVCGYGDDAAVNGQLQHLDIDRIRAIAPSGEAVDYNLQTRKGNSGSPVFVHFTNSSSELPENIPVMGVHVLSETDQLNRGVLLTPDKINWAMGGGNSSVNVFSLGVRPAALGGLPLTTRPQTMLGGLPLGRSAPVAMSRQLGVGQPSFARPLDRSWIVTDERPTGGMNVVRRTFGHPTHDLTGKTTLFVSVPNTPPGGSVRWNIPDATHRTRVLFEAGGGTAQSTSGTSVTLRSLAGGPAAVDCMVFDSGGTVVESDKYWVSSPQFVFVARHPSVDTFFAGIGLGGHTAAIYAEMEGVLRQLYRNVNVRFVFPGDTLPVHLGMASDPAFPGGVQVAPSVFYSETIGDDTILDPEETLTQGSPQGYDPGTMGRNHEPGDMGGAMAPYSLARSLVHRFNQITNVAPIQTAAMNGGLNAADLDLAAILFGRLMGENAAHEVGHFMANAFVPHAASGVMQTGGNRSVADRTGMTPTGTTDPILTDAGVGTINELSADLLRTFEEFLPIDPPIDQASVRARGRVGSFALAQAVRRGGWINGAPSRPFSDPYLAGDGPQPGYLAGGGPQPGWQTRAFDAALHQAIAAGASQEQAEAFFAPLFGRG